MFEPSRMAAGHRMKMRILNGKLDARSLGGVGESGDGRKEGRKEGRKGEERAKVSQPSFLYGDRKWTKKEGRNEGSQKEEEEAERTGDHQVRPSVRPSVLF